MSDNILFSSSHNKYILNKYFNKYVKRGQIIPTITLKKVIQQLYVDGQKTFATTDFGSHTDTATQLTKYREC